MTCAMNAPAKTTTLFARIVASRKIQKKIVPAANILVVAAAENKNNF